MIQIQEKVSRRIFMIESSNQSRIINFYRFALIKEDSEFIENDRKRIIDFFRF